MEKYLGEKFLDKILLDKLKFNQTKSAIICVGG